MSLIDKIKNLHPKKFIKFGKRSGFDDMCVATSDCSDCGSCNSRYMYNYAWLNDLGYGSSAWAPTLTSITQNLGMNNDKTDYLVTYLR